MRPFRAAISGLVVFVASHTRDSADGEQRDRVAEIVIEESLVGGAIARARASIEAAWISSRTARAADLIVSMFEAVTTIDRVRVASGIALVAALTALALRSLAGRPAPLVWMVPTIVAIAAAALPTAMRILAGRK